MTDVAQIVERLDELEKRVTTAEREREEYRALYLQTMERCRKLELGILASKSEHLPDNDVQLSLGVLSMVLGERQAAEFFQPRGGNPPEKNSRPGSLARAS